MIGAQGGGKATQAAGHKGGRARRYKMYNPNYNKDMFASMIEDFIADGAPEYDDLEVDEPRYEDGRWIADAQDTTTTYTLTDDGEGNIAINYSATR